jgi:hypothetical protein
VSRTAHRPLLAAGVTLVALATVGAPAARADDPDAVPRSRRSHVVGTLFSSQGDEPAQVWREPAAIRPVPVRRAASDASWEVGLGELSTRPLKPQRLSMKAQLEAGVDALGFEMNQALGALTDGMIGLRFDTHGRTAHVRVGAFGDTAGAAIAGSIKIAKGAARIDAKIDLKLMGTRVHVDLPDVEIIPRSEFGQRYVEVRVPLYELKL